MKKYLFSLIFLLVSYVGFSQKGLSYQAVILDPGKIEIPGQDISSQPLVNGDVWLKFSIYNGSTLQFEEVHKTKTDNYGLVNLLIGSVSSASFNSLVWDGSQKSLQVFVSFNQGGSYTKISDQKLNYNPYALFAETAGKLGATLPISGGGTGATTATDARANLGLDQVNNTSDAAKPVSTATKAALDLKANAADMNTALGLKANETDVTAALALKANNADVTTALDLKANAADMTAALAAKADTGTIKTFVVTQVAAATIVDADAATKGKIKIAGDLGGTADAPTVPGLAAKADAADVIAALALKANSVDMTNALALKANGSTVATSLNLKENAANKSLNVNSDGSSDIKYPSVKAVKTYVDDQVVTGISSVTITDADENTKGKIKLAGDLGGTASNPTVPGLALKANATELLSLTSQVNSNTASISNLAIVANTGSYTDLVNLPTSTDASTLSGTVSVAKGGTGASTLTGLVKGNGTSALTEAVAGSDFQAPISLTTIGTGAATLSGTTINIPIPPLIPNGTTSGNMLYWDGTVWKNLEAGSSAQTLTFINGKPTWRGNNVPNPSIPVVYSSGNIWMDRNLGATQVATNVSDIKSFGNYYQWGRGSDGHEIITSSTTNISSSTDVPYPLGSNTGLFILGITDWRSSVNDNLWQGVNGINNPCPSGFRLPTYSEWDQERASWISNDYLGAFASPLKLPMAGLRGSDGNLQTSNTSNTYPLFGTYWSSDPTGPTSVYTSLNGQQYGNFAWELIFYSKELTTANYAKLNYNIKSSGRSVRCIMASPNNLQGVDLAGTVSVSKGGTGASSINGIVKGNASNVMTAAIAGVDYSSGTSYLSNGGILKNNIYSTTINGVSTNIGTLSVAVAGTDYISPTSTINLGTTSIALNRASAAQALTGISSIDGNASNITATANSTITSLSNLASVGTITSGTISLTTNMKTSGSVTAKNYQLTVPASITSTSNTAIDFSTGSILKITLGNNITSWTITNITPGTFILELTQDAIGGRTVTFPTGWKWAGGTVPTITVTAFKTDIITIVYDGTNYFASAVQNF